MKRPSLVAEGGPPDYATTYLPLLVYRNGFEHLRYGYASAATLLMFAITASIVLVQCGSCGVGAAVPLHDSAV